MWRVRKVSHSFRTPWVSFIHKSDKPVRCILRGTQDSDKGTTSASAEPELTVLPILGMQPHSTAYLDAHDLAAILEVSPATILRRTNRQPHTLPAPAHLGPRFPLRWRQTDVEAWLREVGMPSS